MCFKASAALSETKTRPTSSSSSSSSEEEEEATSINGTVYCQVQAGSRLSPLINSVSNIHAVFERWTLKFAHVFYMSLWNHSRLNFPFHFLSPDSCFFCIFWGYLSVMGYHISREKKNNVNGSAGAYKTRVQNVRAYLSKSGVDIWTFGR